MSWGINPGELTAADREALGLDVSKMETTHSKMETVAIERGVHDNSLSRKLQLMRHRHAMDGIEIDRLERELGCPGRVIRSGCLERTNAERPKPYTRVVSKKVRYMSKAGRTYYRSQAGLAAYMRSVFMRDEDVMAGESPFWDTPFLFGLAIDVPVTAKGKIPRNAGDYDNYIKAWMDAGQWDTAKLFMDDSLRLYRGPCQIRPVPVMPSADGLWRFFWRVETI